MRNTWWLMLNALKINFRKKTTVITFFVLPVLGMLLSGAAYGSSVFGSSSAVHIGLIDHDQSTLSGDLVQFLRNSEQFQVTEMGAQGMAGKIASGELDCVIVIPHGFGAGIYKHRVKKIDLISIKGEIATAGIRSFLNTLLMNLDDIAITAGASKEVFNEIYGRYQQSRRSMGTFKVRDQTSSKGMTELSIGFLIMFMMVGVGDASEMVLKEKRNRTYYRICAAPVPAGIYILGNVLANLVIVVGQIFLAILVMIKLLGLATYIPAVQLFIIMFLLGLAVIGLGLLITAFSKDGSQASVLQALIIIPSCLLAGCFWPIELMPVAVQRISDLFPQKWAITAIGKLQDGAGFGQILPNIGIILGFALAFFLVAAYRFSRNDDLKSFV